MKRSDPVIDRELEKAKGLLLRLGASCVLLTENTVTVSYQTGIAPLVHFIEHHGDFSYTCAADKIIGKAAAFLYILLGVKQVYGEVVSKEAYVLLAKYSVSCFYGVLADAIINRAGTGLCPMEIAVSRVNTPEQAFSAIKETMKKCNIK